jgi:5'-3' exonuclease
MATGAILGIVEKLAELVASHPGHVPIALWDDRCRWREALLPRYKRHRWETPEQVAFLESYLRQVEIARALLRHLGFPQIFCPGFEADDIVGVICRRADPSWLIKLATTDSDWLQAVRTNVEWYSVATGRIVTHTDLGDPDLVAGGPFTSVDHFIHAKALAGDPSDGIPGVVGVGVKTAARIIRDHGSVEALWASESAGRRSERRHPGCPRAGSSRTRISAIRTWLPADRSHQSITSSKRKRWPAIRATASRVSLVLVSRQRPGSFATTAQWKRCGQSMMPATRSRASFCRGPPVMSTGQPTGAICR